MAAMCAGVVPQQPPTIHAPAPQISAIAAAEFLRADVVVRDTPLLPRQARVRLHEQGQVRRRAQRRHLPEHLPRAQAAVHAHGHDPQALQQGRDDLHVRAAEQAARLVQRHGRKDRQARLLGREDRGLELVGVAHRLHERQVRARRAAGLRRLRVERDRVRKVQVAIRPQEPARGPEVQRDQAPARLSHRRPRDLHARAHDGGGVLSIFQSVRAERVRRHDVRARREVRLVDRLHVLGPGQVPRLRQLAGRKAPRLQLRAHRAVQQDDALAQFLQHLSSSDSSLFFSRRKGQSLRAQVLQGGAGSGASARPAPGGRSPCT